MNSLGQLTKDHLALKFLIRKKELNAIRKFINDHPLLNLNAKCKQGRTILYDVVQTVNDDIVHYFLTLTNHRFKINDTDERKISVLDLLLSLKTYEDITPCYNLLLKAGAIEKSNKNEQIRQNYTGNSYHLNGDLPQWNSYLSQKDKSPSRVIYSNKKQRYNDTKQTNNDIELKEHKNNNLLTIIISYIILILLVINKNKLITIMKMFSVNIFYMNKYENIKNDLFLVDVVIAVLTVLVVVHIYLKTKWNGIKVSIIICSIATIAEQLSISLGETHCHFDALIMITKCSSLNSLLFYLPWMYSCYYISQNFNFQTKRSRLLFIGLIHPIFCTMYELTGANNHWWTWGIKIEVLNERFYQVPVMTIAFHYFLGLFFNLLYDQTSTMRLNSFIKIVLCIILPPLAATLCLTSYAIFTPFGFSNAILTLILLLGSFLIILNDNLKNDNGKDYPRVKRNIHDIILLSIPLIFFTFILMILLKDLDLDNKPFQKVLLCNIIIGYIGLLLIFKKK